MRGRSAHLGVCLFVACVLPASAGAQWLHHPTPGIPPTADGKPNLTAPAPLYARPWTVTIPLELAVDLEMLEYFCPENEKDRRRMDAKVQSC